MPVPRGMSQPLRQVAVFGAVIALLLAATLAIMLWNDRGSRL